VPSVGDSFVVYIHCAPPPTTDDTGTTISVGDIDMVAEAELWGQKNGALLTIGTGWKINRTVLLYVRRAQKRPQSFLFCRFVL